ncbi:hypothetical protein H072_2048 [Dactylellina haptotyla CBS 200.50]|uniref:Uncharacterized protein n=1 Tax=Dactylellina haptotyla (strain CBS 200.50) TaxID=1284197 RepID=S8C8E6_DACHA|nr:hypothetical protein H072_2048 [Dactylellina haptotyla CBS 200.50]
MSCFRIYLTLILSFCILSFTNAQSGGGGDNGDVGAKEHLYFQDCTPQQEAIIYTSMKEAAAIAEVVKTPNWQSYAAQEYMGAHLMDSWFGYKDKVPQVFQKAYEWLTRSYWFTGPIVFCESEKRSCTLGRLEHCPILLEFPENDDSATAQASILVCNSFFKQRRLSSVINQAKFCRENYGSHESYNSLIYDLRWYENRAHWFLHAVFHHREVSEAMTVNVPGRAGEPRLKKYLMLPTPYHDQIMVSRVDKISVPVLSPWEAKKLASNSPGSGWNRPGPLGSPTNYALYALAEYVTKQMGEYPDRPYLYSSWASGWAPEGHRMCPEWEDSAVDPDSNGFKPNETEFAIAPWVFTPQGRPSTWPDYPSPSFAAMGSPK